MLKENGCRLGLEPDEIKEVLADMVTSCAGCENLIYEDGLMMCKMANQTTEEE